MDSSVWYPGASFPSLLVIKTGGPVFQERHLIHGANKKVEKLSLFFIYIRAWNFVDFVNKECIIKVWC